MPLSAGDKLGHYEITALLGAGGMGEVYRARDLTLKRDVALKVLPASVSADPDRAARFQREAEILAQLDHPNIAPIFGVVESAQARALALALIEGPTLADQIALGPLPPGDALAIAKQIIDALEYAHERGVVHRDLKPANIKINDEGVVKVLDFGLAKVLEDEPPKSPLSNSPTLTIGHTSPGVILGTAAYMSPEQAIGRPVDRRSDIFSFGAALFEILSGRRAFGGNTTPDVLEAIVKSEPDWSALPPTTPTYLRRLLERLLTKDRKQRLQAIGEARIALEHPAAEPAPVPAETTAAMAAVSRVSRILPWSIAALALLGAAVIGAVHFRETTRTQVPMRFTFTLPGEASFMELSPDGRYLSFVSNEGGPSRIWIRPLDATEAHFIPGTDGATFPFWSPDGENLGFFAQGKLKRIALAGGPAQTLADAPTGRGGTWNRDGVIVYAPTIFGDLYRISADGGMPTVVAQRGRVPEFLLGGKHFFFISLQGKQQNILAVGSLDGSAPVQIPAGKNSRGIYVPPQSGARIGYVLFLRQGTLREGTLMALPFDPEKLAATGGPVPLAENVPIAGTLDYGGFAASENGVLLYMTGGVPLSNLAWVDRSGKRIPSKDTSRPFSGQVGSERIRVLVTEGTLHGGSSSWLVRLSAVSRRPEIHDAARARRRGLRATPGNRPPQLAARTETIKWPRIAPTSQWRTIDSPGDR